MHGPPAMRRRGGSVRAGGKRVLIPLPPWCASAAANAHQTPIFLAKSRPARERFSESPAPLGAHPCAPKRPALTRNPPHDPRRVGDPQVPRRPIRGASRPPNRYRRRQRPPTIACGRRARPASVSARPTPRPAARSGVTATPVAASVARTITVGGGVSVAGPARSAALSSAVRPVASPVASPGRVADDLGLDRGRRRTA